MCAKEGKKQTGDAQQKEEEAPMMPRQIPPLQPLGNGQQSMPNPDLQTPINEEPLTAYDESFIDTSNALSYSFYMRGREMGPFRWRLNNDLERKYETGQPLPNYNRISLFHVYK
jgi:hypothetical protein